MITSDWKAYKRKEMKDRISTKIKDRNEYRDVMDRIHIIMKKGETHTTKTEEKELQKLALAAQEYERSIYIVPSPKTLQGLIELRMYEMRLKQKDVAIKLNLSNTKLSLILNGKQKPDVAFLKAAHKELNIDANQLLALV